jgi:uncharacterized protein involved in exopolysaccharide biosynthesis
VFGGPGGIEEPDRELDLRRLWATLVRRRKLMLMVFGGFVGAVLLFTLLQHRQYTTEVKMIAGFASGGSGEGSGAGDTQLPILNALLAASSGKNPETYAELLQQAPVAQDVITQLNLHSSVAGLLSHLIVRPVTETSILSLRVAWSDPVTSARIANAYANVFVTRERHLVSQQAETAVGFLEQQLPEAQQRMSSTQTALAAYQVRSGIADLPTQTQSDINTISAIEAKQQASQLEAEQAEAQLGVVRAQLAHTPPTIVGQQNVAANPVNAQLSQQVSTLRTQLDAARQQYTDRHPTVVALKSQLAAAERQCGFRNRSESDLPTARSTSDRLAVDGFRCSRRSRNARRPAPQHAAAARAPAGTGAAHRRPATRSEDRRSRLRRALA